MPDHKTLPEALLAAKADMPNLRRTATNPHFGSKFVPLDEIVEKVTPILSAHGLVWMTLPTSDEQGRPALRYRLLHQSGEAIEDVMPLCIGEKVTPQAQGSALSYGRRYAAMAVLDLVGNDDDDGNGASGGDAQPHPALVAAASGMTVKQLKQAHSDARVSYPSGPLFCGLTNAQVSKLEQALLNQRTDVPVDPTDFEPPADPPVAEDAFAQALKETFEAVEVDR